MSKSMEVKFIVNDDPILEDMIVDQLGRESKSVDSEMTVLVKDVSEDVKLCVVALYKAVAIEDSKGMARSIKTFHLLVETSTKKITDITGLLGFAVE